VIGHQVVFPVRVVTVQVIAVQAEEAIAMDGRIAEPGLPIKAELRDGKGDAVGFI
jgi:hypothetical protein